jgi:serine phosphatase RsbU (regulator of sigma subunit)
VYAVLDLRTLRLRVACAGHPSPVVLRGHDHLEFIRGKGGALGLFEDEHWEETEVDLHTGDRLLLHSDGFEAAFPEDQASRVSSQEPSPMHVQAFQQVLDVDSPAEIVKRLGERVDRAMMASANADDITLMVLRAG